jgi:hypothetical protein
MTSGHLAAGSRLLVLAPDDGWKRMLCARDRELFEEWEVWETMDVDTAKEWSSIARARLAWEMASGEGDEPKGAPPPKVRAPSASSVCVPTV